MIARHERKRLAKLARRAHHPFVHRVHARHGISYKTLYCMKEYGPRSSAAAVIVKESLKVIIIASLVSALGGVALQSIEAKLVAIVPFLVILPAFNDMVGDYGTIISSKFTTMIYTGRVRGNVWKSRHVRELFLTMITVAALSAVYIALAASAITVLHGVGLAPAAVMKILVITVVSTLVLVSFIFAVSVSSGLYICRKREDPNNFLIPISTSIADLGSIAVVTAMILLLF